MSGFSEAIRKVWYMPQHCENDKLPWLKGRIFLSKAKCCLTLHRSCRFSLEYLQLYQFSHVWKSTGGPHLAWISICFLIKYSEGIEVMVGTAKVLYWFAISSFTKSNLMCIFHIQIYFSYSLIIHSFMYSIGSRILGLEFPAKTYKIRNQRICINFDGHMWH